MKKLIILALLLTCNLAIYAQIQGSTTLYAGSSTFTQNKVVFKKKTTTTYDQNSTYNIGMVFTQSDSTTKTFRSAYEFSLESIPTNATITQATVYYTTTGSSYSFKLNLVSTLSPSDYEANFNTIASGSGLESSMAYGMNSKVSSSIKSAIQSSLAARTMIIGALSNSEAASGSTASLSFYITVNYTRPPSQISFSAHNDMEGFVGGHIGVGVNASASDRPSPYSAIAAENQTVNIEAYDSGNSWSGHSFVFNDSEAPQNKSYIEKTGGQQNQVSYNSTISYTFLQNDNNSEFTAYLIKVCNSTLQISGGTVYVDYQAQSGSSVVIPKIKDNSFYAFASNYSYNGVDYTFTSWQSNGSYYGNTIVPTENRTFNAVYSAKPNVNNRSLATDSDPNENVVLIWNAHPNNNVTGYNVYRKVKSNGVVGPEEQIATLNGRTTTTYTDYAYIITNSPNDDRLMYDVRPVYTDADNTAIESDPYYVTIAFGLMNIKMNKDERVITQANLIPDTYSISNHPNPFNPTTVINYQLPTEGFVTIKVYDMLGKEVAELVNENKAAGYYKVNYDASKLASGIYIYSINAGSFSSSKKMILTK